MRTLTPTIILQFQGKSSVTETYKIVLKNITQIVSTMMDKNEIRSAKLELMEAIAILKIKEEHIWAKENGIDTRKQNEYI